MVQINCHKYEIVYILEDCEKDCHLKKETAICDSFRIDYIEETSLHDMHTLIILFTRIRLQGNKFFFSENRISRIFTRISSKE